MTPGLSGSGVQVEVNPLALSSGSSAAREVEASMPIDQRVFGAIMRIGSLALGTSKSHEAVRTLVRKSCELGGQFHQVYGARIGSAPDENILASIEQILRVFAGIMEFMRKQTRRRGLKRLLQTYTSASDDFSRLSFDLDAATQDFFLAVALNDRYGGHGTSSTVEDALRYERYSCFVRPDDAIEKIMPQANSGSDRTARPALSIETRLAVHYRDTNPGSSGFRFAFAFKNQHVEITAPQMAPFAHGSSGRVIRAFFKLNHAIQNVALKVLRRLTSPDEKELLRREVDIWSMTNHPRVLPYYGTCQVGDGQIAIVSPYMEHGNLRQYIAANRSADRLVLVQQVADGLEYLHDHARIVHGDLKCENILIASDGSALISDFGLSTLVDAGLTVTPVDLRMHHTLRFAAPELLLDQAVNEGALDRPRSKTTASDVYAFGMLVYQACTGLLPWRNVSDMGVCLNILHGPLPERPADATLLNDALWELCVQCWSREPSARPRIGYIRERL